ncbi:hypothetical protein OIU34_14955 [Pararhizobium sp. BT-229]|uniref:hypothetical protein n=1 Tax=Pararhizobium sp. BT-229 TaxID=2986923 RepID=UPI0021F7D412|nr:hypothetical protein [Pararhizobium sp. BT-229]MCV9963206.1 hypothetical protein [Pararhizobium sp. BT-229]
MAKVVVIGIPGETDLWLADLTAGTVTALPKPLTGELATAEALRSAGGAVIKGVDFAVAVSSEAQVFAGHYDG